MFSTRAFRSIQAANVEYFRSLLQPGQIVVDKADLAVYNQDWTKKMRGHSELLLQPKTTQEVSAILKYCNENLLAVTPQGGSTGLVGGNVPTSDEIILSTSKLNRVLSFDSPQGVLRAEAGCVLHDLQEYARAFGAELPLDLGARGSC
jgi:FAD/FMN-containing dehydrogenase